MVCYLSPLPENAMILRIPYIKEMVWFAVAAAVVYAGAAVFYVQKQAFSESWVLYLGNFLFAGMIGVFIGWYYKRNKASTDIVQLIIAASKTTMAGILFSCTACLLLLFVLKPATFAASSLHSIQLQQSPAQFAGAHQGFALILFMNAVLGNAAVALFISLLLPFSMLRNRRSGRNNPAKR
jgi:hypothetical protein